MPRYASIAAMLLLELLIFYYLRRGAAFMLRAPIIIASPCRYYISLLFRQAIFDAAAILISRYKIRR